jgi:hypothetical protein
VAQKAKYQFCVLLIFLKTLICGGSNSISSGWKFGTVAKVSPFRQDEKIWPTSFSLQEIYHLVPRLKREQLFFPCEKINADYKPKFKIQLNKNISETSPSQFSNSNIRIQTNSSPKSPYINFP